MGPTLTPLLSASFISLVMSLNILTKQIFLVIINIKLKQKKFFLEFCPILTEFSKIHFYFISKFLVIPLRMKIKIKNEFETENETVHIQIYSMTDAVIIIETVITQRIRKKFLEKLCRRGLVKGI